MTGQRSEDEVADLAMTIGLRAASVRADLAVTNGRCANDADLAVTIGLRAASVRADLAVTMGRCVDDPSLAVMFGLHAASAIADLAVTTGRCADDPSLAVTIGLYAASAIADLPDAAATVADAVTIGLRPAAVVADAMTIGLCPDAAAADAMTIGLRPDAAATVADAMTIGLRPDAAATVADAVTIGLCPDAAAADLAVTTGLPAASAVADLVVTTGLRAASAVADLAVTTGLRAASAVAGLAVTTGLGVDATRPAVGAVMTDQRSEDAVVVVADLAVTTGLGVDATRPAVGAVTTDQRSGDAAVVVADLSVTIGLRAGAAADLAVTTGRRPLIGAAQAIGRTIVAAMRRPGAARPTAAHGRGREGVAMAVVFAQDEMDSPVQIGAARPLREAEAAERRAGGSRGTIRWPRGAKRRKGSPIGPSHRACRVWRRSRPVGRSFQPRCGRRKAPYSWRGPFPKSAPGSPARTRSPERSRQTAVSIVTGARSGMAAVGPEPPSSVRRAAASNNPKDRPRDRPGRRARFHTSHRSCVGSHKDRPVPEAPRRSCR